MKLSHFLSSALIAAAIPNVAMSAGATRLNAFILLNQTNDTQLIVNKTVSIWAQCKTEDGFNVLRLFGATTATTTGTVLNGIDQYTGVDSDFLERTDVGDFPANAEDAELLVISAPVGGTTWGNSDPYYGFIIDTKPVPTLSPVLNPNGLMINSTSAALGVTPLGCYVSMTVEPLAVFKKLAPTTVPK